MGLWVNINWQYNATYIQYKDCSKAHYLHDFLRQLLRRKDPSLTSTSGRRQKPANKEANGSSNVCMLCMLCYVMLCMYVCMYICMYLSIYPSIYLSIYLSIHLSIYLSILSIYVCVLSINKGYAVAAIFWRIMFMIFPDFLVAHWEKYPASTWIVEPSETHSLGRLHV